MESREKIRFLGINTPEIRKSHGGLMQGVEQPWGRDAANYLKRLLTGKKVSLEFDGERSIGSRGEKHIQRQPGQLRWRGGLGPGPKITKDRIAKRHQVPCLSMTVRRPIVRCPTRAQPAMSARS